MLAGTLATRLVNSAARDIGQLAANPELSQQVLARLRELGLPAPQQRLSTASFLLTLAVLQQTNAIAPLAQAVADQFATGADAPFACVPSNLGITVAPYSLLTRRDTVLPPAARTILDLITRLIDTQPTEARNGAAL